MTARVSKFTYGVFGNPAYEPSNPEHVRRANKLYIDPMGIKRVPDRFYTALIRVCRAQSLLCVSD